MGGGTQGVLGTATTARLPSLPAARTTKAFPQGWSGSLNVAPRRPRTVARTTIHFGPMGVSAVTTTRSRGLNDSPRTTSGCTVMSRSFGVAAALTVGATPRSAVAQTAVTAASVRITSPTLTRRCEETMKPSR
jgi:hypothetical protein